MIRIALLLIALCSAARGMSLAELGSAISNFYIAPSEAAFRKIQSEADRLGPTIPKGPSQAALLISVAIFRISEKHGWQISGDGTICQTANELLVGKSKLAKSVRNDRQVSGTKLDIWWMGFFATGDTSYLEKLMRFAGSKSPETDRMAAAIIGAATWSFVSNCKQHEAVKNFARKCFDDPAYAEKRDFLSECIK